MQFKLKDVSLNKYKKERKKPLGKKHIVVRGLMVDNINYLNSSFLYNLYKNKTKNCINIVIPEGIPED